MTNIVAGLPESGGTILMHMLERGGYNVVANKNVPLELTCKQDRYHWQNSKILDQYPHLIDEVQSDMLFLYSMYLYNLPEDRNYRIIFVERDLREIAISGLEKINEGVKNNHARVTQIAYLMHNHMKQLKNWINKQTNIDVLWVRHKDLLDDPMKESSKIQNFLEQELNIEAMATVIDPSLYPAKIA